MDSANFLNLKFCRSFFEKVGSFALSLSYWKFCLFFTTGFILKSGFRGIQPWGDFTPITSFPKPIETFSSNSYGLILISKLFSVGDKDTYFILNIMLFIVLLFIFYYLIYQNFQELSAKLLLLIFVSSPIFVVLAGNIGRHDLLTIIGMLGFFIVKNRFSRFFFLTLSCLGSPEHILAALLLYYIGLKIYVFKEKELETKLAITFCFFYNVLSSFWVASQTGGGNRFGNIFLEPGFMKIALRNFINNFALEWYSYFGFYWITLIIAIICLRQKLRLRIFCLLMFPLLFNIVMVDKTRDFVIAIIPLALLIHKPIFYLIIAKLKSISNSDKNFYIGLFLYFIIIFPSIEITFEGRPRAPFEWAITKFLEMYS